MENKEVDLQSPWVITVKKLMALFARDPEVTVEFGSDDCTLCLISVSSETKLEALKRLLPEKIQFGNVMLQISIVNVVKEKTTKDIIKDAFYGNPVLDKIVSHKSVFGDNLLFTFFKKEVLQVPGDSLQDPNGIISFLAEDFLRFLQRENENPVKSCFTTSHE